MYRKFWYQIEFETQLALLIFSHNFFSLPIRYSIDIFLWSTKSKITKLQSNDDFAQRWTSNLIFHFQLSFSHEVWYKIEILLFSHLIGEEKSLNGLKLKTWKWYILRAERGILYFLINFTSVQGTILFFFWNQPICDRRKRIKNEKCVEKIRKKCSKMFSYAPVEMLRKDS